MTRDELLKGLTCEPEPFTTPGLSCWLRPLDVDDNLAVSAFQDAHGPALAYQMIFVRAVRDAAGNRLLADADAPLVATFKSGPVGAVIERVTAISKIDRGDAPAGGKARSTTDPT